MFEPIISKIQEKLDEEDSTREQTLLKVRKIIRDSGGAIRALHKGEFEKAKKLLDETFESIKSLEELKKNSPNIYHKNYVTDAQQEFCEARTFYALLTNEDFTQLTPELLVISDSAYLLGLADLIGELRRFALDSIRRDEIDKAEKALNYMSDIYENLITLDYPSGLIPDLRRKCDVARSIIEKTRGDFTLSLQFHRYARNI